MTQIAKNGVVLFDDRVPPVLQRFGPITLVAGKAPDEPKAPPYVDNTPAQKALAHSLGGAAREVVRALGGPVTTPAARAQARLVALRIADEAAQLAALLV